MARCSSSASCLPRSCTDRRVRGPDRRGSLVLYLVSQWRARRPDIPQTIARPPGNHVQMKMEHRLGRRFARRADQVQAIWPKSCANGAPDADHRLHQPRAWHAARRPQVPHMRLGNDDRMARAHRPQGKERESIWRVGHDPCRPLTPDDLAELAILVQSSIPLACHALACARIRPGSILHPQQLAGAVTEPDPASAASAARRIKDLPLHLQPQRQQRAGPPGVPLPEPASRAAGSC